MLVYVGRVHVVCASNYYRRQLVNPGQRSTRAALLEHTSIRQTEAMKAGIPSKNHPLLTVMGLEMETGVEVTTLMPPDPTTVGVVGTAATAVGAGAGVGAASTCCGAGAGTTTTAGQGGGAGSETE